MLELFVASHLADLIPAIGLQSLDYIATVHE